MRFAEIPESAATTVRVNAPRRGTVTTPRLTSARNFLSMAPPSAGQHLTNDDNQTCGRSHRRIRSTTKVAAKPQLADRPASRTCAWHLKAVAPRRSRRQTSLKAPPPRLKLRLDHPNLQSHRTGSAGATQLSWRKRLNSALLRGTARRSRNGMVAASRHPRP